MNKNIISIALENTKKYIAILIVLSIFISYLTLQIALNLKYVIDGILFNKYETIPIYLYGILNNNYVHDLLVFAVIIIFFNFVQMIINYLRDRITTKFKLKINSNLKLKLYKHILNLEYNEYNSYDKSEMMQRVNEDAEVYSNFFNSQFNLILDIIFLSIFIITESIELNYIIAIYFLITIIFILLFSIWYIRRLNKTVEELIYRKKKLLQNTIININNFKMIRMFNKQKEEVDKYKKSNNKATKTSIDVIKLALFYEIINDHITYMKQPAIYIIGGIAVIRRKNDFRWDKCHY